MDQGTKVLVVDDMPAIRLILKGMLEQLGFKNVIEADSGDAAWELIRNQVPDAQDPVGLVIADWNMQGMTGVDLLRAIRGFALTRELRFLMISAEADRSHLTEAKFSGSNGYIVKPFTLAQIQEALENMKA